jgi:hypothetical protein
MKIDDLFGDYYDPNRKKKLEKYAEEIRQQAQQRPRHITKNCSVCGHTWAHYSNDYGRTWQCKQHTTKKF